MNGSTFRNFDSVSFDSTKKPPMQTAKLFSSPQNAKSGIYLGENNLEATFPCSQAIDVPNSFCSKNLPHYFSTHRLHPYLSDYQGPCWCSYSQPTLLGPEQFSQTLWLKIPHRDFAARASLAKAWLLVTWHQVAPFHCIYIPPKSKRFQFPSKQQPLVNLDITAIITYAYALFA